MKNTSDPRRTLLQPHYLFGGRIRVSTLILIALFIALMWIHENHRAPAETQQEPIHHAIPSAIIPDSTAWVPHKNTHPNTGGKQQTVTPPPEQVHSITTLSQLSRYTDVP